MSRRNVGRVLGYSDGAGGRKGWSKTFVQRISRRKAKAALNRWLKGDSRQRKAKEIIE